MRVFRLALLVCAVLAPALVAAPAAEATDCVRAPPACPPGAVPWAKRAPDGCGPHGVTWTCAWLW